MVSFHPFYKYTTSDRNISHECYKHMQNVLNCNLFKGLHWRQNIKKNWQNHKQIFSLSKSAQSRWYWRYFRHCKLMKMILANWLVVVQVGLMSTLDEATGNIEFLEFYACLALIFCYKKLGHCWKLITNEK